MNHHNLRSVDRSIDGKLTPWEDAVGGVPFNPPTVEGLSFWSVAREEYVPQGPDYELPLHAGDVVWTPWETDTGYPNYTPIVTSPPTFVAEGEDGPNGAGYFRSPATATGVEQVSYRRSTVDTATSGGGWMVFRVSALPAGAGAQLMIPNHRITVAALSTGVIRMPYSFGLYDFATSIQADRWEFIAWEGTNELWYRGSWLAGTFNSTSGSPTPELWGQGAQLVLDIADQAWGPTSTFDHASWKANDFDDMLAYIEERYGSEIIAP